MSANSANTANLVVVPSALRNVGVRSGSVSFVDFSDENMLEALGEAMDELALNERNNRRAKRSAKKMAFAQQEN
jgi:hypothetical protein